jgi:hypothetical protein
MNYQDGIRHFWAFGTLKSPDAPRCKPANWLMDTNRLPKKKEFKGEINEMNGYKSFHKKIVEFENPKTTTGFLRARECQANINQMRENKKIKLIDFGDTPVPAPQQPVHKHTKTEVKKCKAINLNNKHCGYKATCGDFCKRHTPH